MAIPNKLWNGKCRTDRYKICRLDTGLLAKNWTKNKFSGAAAAAEIDRRTGWGGLPFRFWGYGIEAVTAQWNSFGISFFYLLFFFFFLFLSCEQLAIIGTLSAPNLMELWQRKLPFVSFLFINGLVLQGKNAAWNAIALIDEILQIASTRLYWWLFHDQRNMTTNFVPAS